MPQSRIPWNAPDGPRQRQRIRRLFRGRPRAPAGRKEMRRLRPAALPARLPAAHGARLWIGPGRTSAARAPSTPMKSSPTPFNPASAISPPTPSSSSSSTNNAVFPPRRTACASLPIWWMPNSNRKPKPTSPSASVWTLSSRTCRLNCPCRNSASPTSPPAGPVVAVSGVKTVCKPLSNLRTEACTFASGQGIIFRLARRFVTHLIFEGLAYKAHHIGQLHHVTQIDLNIAIAGVADIGYIPCQSAWVM